MSKVTTLAVASGLTFLATAWVTARTILTILEALDRGLAYDIDNDPWEDEK